MPRRISRNRGRIRDRDKSQVLISRGAFCTMIGVSERQLAVWEHEELLTPAQVLESAGQPQPLYDRSALERARVIRTLEQELEVNLPGIGIILHLLDRLGR
jgi:DNA-binding transcriptional MerR regulator